MQNLKERQKADQHQGDRRQRAEKARAREHSPNPVGAEGTSKFEQSTDENRTNANVPRMNGSGWFTEAAPLGCQKSWAKHEEDDAEYAGCIEPQRHRGNRSEERRVGKGCKSRG